MEWQQSKLTNISQVRTGKWDANHATEDGAYKFFTCAYEALLCDTKRFDGECLILPGNGANVGEVFYYSGEFDAYQRTYVVSDIKVLPKFLFYHMKCFWRERNLYKQHGAATNYLKIGNFHEYEVSYPDTPEQKRIVAILDEVFADIEQVRTKTEQNLKNARELFESYLQQVAGEKKPLGEFVSIKTGKLNANAAVEGGQFPFFTCSREVFAIDSFSFDCEAILLAGNNASGDFNVKHYNGKFDAYQRTYVITITDEHKLLYPFLYYQMIKSLKELKEGSVGAGTRFLKIGMIQNLKISIPSLSEQKKILSTLLVLKEELDRLEQIYEEKLEHLDELKQSILQKAFSGELMQKNNQGAVA